MITNGILIILLPQAPNSLSDGDDLSRMKSDGSLRQYFGLISQLTSEEKVVSQINGESNHDTVVVVEKGFFTSCEKKDLFRKGLEKRGVQHDRILFGEDCGSRLILLLEIKRLCNS